MKHTRVAALAPLAALIVLSLFAASTLPLPARDELIAPADSNAPVPAPFDYLSGGTVDIAYDGTPLRPAPAAPSPPLVPKKLYHAAPGPWGDLEYYLTYLQAPLHVLDNYDYLISDITAWHFPHRTVQEAYRELLAIGLTAESLQWAGNLPAGHVPTESGVKLFPPAPFIASLSPERRAALAALLARYPANKLDRRLAVVESGDLWSWYREAGLSESTIATIASVAYTMRGSTVVSDWPYVLSTIQDRAERDRCRRAVTRTRTLVLRLNLGAPESLDEIKAYWSGGSKQKDVLPIMESITETPGVERLDIAHLLPPLPRKLLYTFPNIAMAAGGKAPDCYWSAANFFRQEPDEYYLRSEALLDELEDRWEAAGSTLQFGDLLLVIDKDTHQPKHAATYIADDIVFTKNGTSLANPWILMRYGDMMARYKRETHVAVLAFRRVE